MAPLACITPPEARTDLLPEGLAAMAVPRGLAEEGRGFDGSGSFVPRLASSVAGEIGIKRFVYLQGRSGKRYVFSAIAARETGLYENAVMTLVERGANSPLWTGLSKALPLSTDIIAASDRFDLYVHLIARSAGEKHAVLDDLGGSTLTGH